MSNLDHQPTVLRSPGQVRRLLDDERARGRRISLVPTMGALHEGHLRLVDAAREHGELVLVSIFVNPTQFGAGEDLDRYPRDLDRDRALLTSRGTDLIFAPTVDEMYPPGHATTVSVAGLTTGLCAAQRAGHFDGVATIVTKLFNIVGPCTALFGRKDYQQLQVIRRLTADLDLPVAIVGVPTVRETDGLALSSRNAYLSPDERDRALALPRGLTAAHRLYLTGERSAAALRAAAREPIAAGGDPIDYVTLADPTSLEPFGDDARVTGAVLLAVAARVGATRLIDNTVIGEDAPPIPLEGAADR